MQASETRTAHTPGPWEIDCTSYDLHTDTGETYELLPVTAGADLSSWVGFVFAGDDANAALIAAAPALLAALEAITPDTHGCTAKHTFITDPDCKSCTIAVAAREAIQQARGE